MDGNPYPHNPGPLTGDIPQQFAQHEERSQQRYEMLSEQIKQSQHSKGEKMGENVSEKTIVNVDGGRGGSDSGSIAAIIAAMNSGGGNDALPAMIAAMNNNRPVDGGMAALAPLLAGMNNNGINSLWPILLLALLRGRGGFGGDGDGGCHGGIGAGQAAFDQSILNGITGLTAAVPTTALETQNSINGNIATQALAMQNGFANVKDAVQNVGALNLSATNAVERAVQTSALQTQIAITNDGEKTRAILVRQYEDTLNRELTVAQAALAEERNARRTRDVEVNVSQQVTQTQLQAQAQQQQQQQFAQLFGLIGGLANQIQISRQAQDIVNLGTMTASGTQAAANTQVR